MPFSCDLAYWPFSTWSCFSSDGGEEKNKDKKLY